MFINVNKGEIMFRGKYKEALKLMACALAFSLPFASVGLSAETAASAAKTAVAKKAAAPVKAAANAAKPAAQTVAAPATQAAKTAAKPAAAAKKAVSNLAKPAVNKAATPTKAQQKKKVKTKQVLIDCKIVAFARTASDAEAAADAKAVSMSSGKIKPLIKDATFLADTTGRYACLKRMNYTDKIPENWYLESQMVVGFSTISYERAYNDAVQRSAGKVRSIREKNKLDKISDESKNPTAEAAIAYDYVFAKTGKEYYCRLFFRYMMPK